MKGVYVEKEETNTRDLWQWFQIAHKTDGMHALPYLLRTSAEVKNELGNILFGERVYRNIHEHIENIPTANKMVSIVIYLLGGLSWVAYLETPHLLTKLVSVMIVVVLLWLMYVAWGIHKLDSKIKKFDHAWRNPEFLPPEWNSQKVHPETKEFLYGLQEKMRQEFHSSKKVRFQVQVFPHLNDNEKSLNLVFVEYSGARYCVFIK
jgi:hypothetical protein